VVEAPGVVALRKAAVVVVVEPHKAVGEGAHLSRVEEAVVVLLVAEETWTLEPFEGKLVVWVEVRPRS